MREDLFIPLEHILKLSCHDDWLDIIYCDNPDNLPNLTEDSYLIYGLNKLTEKQREVFYLKIIKGFTTKEVSEMLGTTSRNIRKHYSKAIETLQAVLYETELAKPYTKRGRIILVVPMMEMEMTK